MEAESGHALVIGASSGIGKTLAERLVPRMAITALGRRADRMAALAPLGIDGIACDVTDFAAVSATIATAVAKHGKVTSFIYCAGLQKIKPMRIAKPEEIAEIVRINLEAPLQLATLFTSRRITTDDAVFCAVSSIAAARPEPGIIAYSSAKAGLEAMIKGLAREAAPRRAVGVAPGWLDTEMTQGYASIYNEEFRANLEKSAPRGIATVAAIVDGIEFLISPAAAFITGEIVTIDGGASL